MPFPVIILVSALALTSTLYVLRQSLRLPDSWRFLTQGREILLERAKKVCLPLHNLNYVH
jgi:hypothetical protein